MTRPRTAQRALLLALLVCSWLSATPQAQEAGTQPPRGVQQLPPDTVAAIVAGAQPDNPATLTVANRDIVTLQAAVLGRSSAARVAAARHLIQETIASTRVVKAGSRSVGQAMVITLDD